jgi:YwiC-like protein
MSSILVADQVSDPRSSQRARTRALVVPREHGAWGLLFVPLFTGVAVGAASAQRVWPLVAFTLVALCLFWLRTPAESLLGTTPLSAQTNAERRVAWLACIGLAFISAGCLAGLFWNGRNRDLLIFGGVAGLAFAAQTVLMKQGRKLRMAAQLVGAIGLTSTAPAAYYVASGHLDLPAWVLWAANWMFAANQIHFVQLRIHAARAATFEEKCDRGWRFFVGQVLMIMALMAAVSMRAIPAMVAAAFLPVLMRGFWWFFRAPQPLQVRSLGWSEMKQGVAFGILLAVASTLR